MPRAYYTYRIQLSNYERVQIEKRDSQHQSLGEHYGALRYKEKLSELTPLLKLAKDGVINHSSKTRLLGEILFDVLFDHELLPDFVSFYHQVVQQEQQLLRVELNIDEQGMPDLAALPWEFLCLPARANLGTIWVGTVPDLAFTRRRLQWIPAQPIQLEQDEKLRIALVVSDPPDLPSVEYKSVQEALEQLAIEQSNRVELLPIVASANPEAINTILSKKPHIFHFIGHGRFENENMQEIGQIAFVNPDFGAVMWVHADDFSELFNKHRPGIVMLQACEGATLSTSQAFVGLASRVLQQNIPVVVAMQYEVSNATASRFARHFYQQLVEDDPVDIAAQYGRRAIALGPTQYRKRDFATPVIFMRVSDGYLFNRPGSKSAAQAEQADDNENKAGITQNVQQQGKNNLNFGQNSGPLHIGDTYNSIEQTVQQSNSEFSTNAGTIHHARIGHNYHNYNYQNYPETIRQIVQEELKSPQLNYFRLVCEGLSTLVEAVAIPEIRDAVIAFNTDFKTACDYICLLASYKDLHDLLHRLEFECYKSILLEEHRFPDDQITLETLVEHGLTLKSLIDQLVAIANQEVLVTQEILWVTELEQACSEFQVALQKRNTQCFKKSIRLLNRVLLLQSSRINTYINAAAQALRLPYLIIAMRNILQTLRSSKLSIQQITQFQQGLEALEKLQDRLWTLVVTHDSWQVIDVELRQLEISLNYGTDDLTTSWFYLKNRVRSLCNGEADSWSVSIQEYGEHLEQVLSASIQNPIDVKRYFRFYRKGSSERFYQVDKTLKQLCDELRTIGEPLASVLRAIT